MATPCGSIDFLMVGKTGNGKSSTGNMILKKLAFDTSSDMTSYTVKPKIDYSAFDDNILKVVDSPGLNDTMLSVEESIKQFVQAMIYAIAANPEGYHCILIVQRFGGRFTREDVKVVGILKEVFGEQFKHHAIVLLTCGDMFEMEMAKSRKTFETWCDEQEGEFKKLLRDCGNRVVLFDNKTTDEVKVRTQICNLIDKVREVSKDGKRYSNETFEQAKNTRDNLIIKSQIPRLSDEVIQETALLIRELGLIDFGSPETEVPRLKQVIGRVDQLHERIVKEDKKTNTLKTVLDLVDKFSQPLKEHLKVMEGAMHLKKRKEKLEEDIKSCEFSKSDRNAYLKQCKARSTQSVAGRQNPDTPTGSSMASPSGNASEAAAAHRVTGDDAEDTQLKELPRSLSKTEQELMEELNKTKEKLRRLQSEQEKKAREEQQCFEGQYRVIRDEQQELSLWKKIVDALHISLERFRNWWSSD